MMSARCMYMVDRSVTLEGAHRRLPSNRTSWRAPTPLGALVNSRSLSFGVRIQISYCKTCNSRRPGAHRRVDRCLSRRDATPPRGMGAAPWLCLLCVASVSMTLGNKALMMGPLAANKHLVLVFQNAISVTVLNGGAVAGLISFERVDRRQLLFYVWDAAMLVVQLFTSFVALQHLPVATTTVVRALAIPLVAWSELLVMGTRLPASKQASAAVVMAGALLYAREDLVGQSSSQSVTGAPPAPGATAEWMPRRDRFARPGRRLPLCPLQPPRVHLQRSPRPRDDVIVKAVGGRYGHVHPGAIHTNLLDRGRRSLGPRRCSMALATHAATQHL